MEQWVERLSTFLGVPARTIGRIGGGRKKPGGVLDVALVQSLVRKDTFTNRYLVSAFMKTTQGFSGLIPTRLARIMPRRHPPEENEE